MVGDTRIELVTPSVSGRCSPAELTAHGLNEEKFYSPFYILSRLFSVFAFLFRGVVRRFFRYDYVVRMAFFH